MKSARFAALALCLGTALPMTLAGCDKVAPSGTEAQQDAPAGLAGVRAAIVARNFGEAVDLAAAEVKAHPKDAAARFEQARAEALAGNEGRALDALDQAIALGLPDAPRALEDPAFAQISGSDRFAALLDRANPVAGDAAGSAARTAIVAGSPRGRAGDGVSLREKPGGGTHIQAGDVVLDTDF
ncbi:TPR end-of-group domain-containing protein [Novosphingobium sp. BL-52-GroH]|uniref:TPR end-of-group domain-containing protein n=1 Tax=Novosphingobium sp. BL-52-GroH TaxID=3349877 RepID=UPI00384E4719